jgi:light-regulated signal transduction histidine kinase (bacteriophytochrome)
MRSRLIADVARPSVKVLHSLRLAENIILAGSQLRGVTGCHAQYLQNMGVHATLVLSIVTGTSDAQHTSPWEGENAKKTGGPPPRSPLWGLLVCHHYGGPYRVNYDHRAAVEFLIKVWTLLP